MFAGAESPEAMLAEIRAAEDVRDARLASRKERMRRMAGPFAMRGGGAEYDPENGLYEYIAYVLPRAAYSNPRAFVRTRRRGMPQVIARALESGLNRMVVEQKMWRMLRRCCVDYLADYAVAMIAPAPRDGMAAGGRPVWWPQVYPIDPELYFEDPLAQSADERRFQGHVILRDLDSLIEEAEANPEDWHVENVKMLTAEGGVEKVHKDRHGVPSRKQVALYEVFVPEQHGTAEDPDDGFAGTIFTLGAASSTDNEKTGEQAWSLRRPRPFYGPREGPFRTARFLDNPYVPMGTSPTIPAEAQLRELSRAALANLRAERKYKRVVTLLKGDASAIKALQAPDLSYLPVTNESVVRTVEIGGVSQQGLAHQEMRRDATDRLLGMHDIQRGLVTGEGTASEVLTAQAGSDARINDVVKVFHRFVGELLSGMAWYLYHDDRVVVGVDGEGFSGMMNPTMRGGSTPGMTFDDLELEVAPYSLEMDTPQTRRVRGETMLTTLGWVMQAIPQAPYLRWEAILPELGDLMGVEGLEDFVDVEGAEEWAAQMAQYQGEGPQQQPKAQLGRQVAGRPLNIGVGMKPSGGRGGKGPASGPDKSIPRVQSLGGPPKAAKAAGSRTQGA